VPDGAFEIDATNGILMPGMIDTHRHMWQTAMRGYGADWTLTQYFVWYYHQYGKLFRPEDVYAGIAISALTPSIPASPRPSTGHTDSAPSTTPTPHCSRSAIIRAGLSSHPATSTAPRGNGQRTPTSSPS